jgi:FkbM family methyltransferase
MDGARLDVPNDPRSNGEGLVQEAVLNCSSKTNAVVVFDVGANIGEWTHSLLAKADAQKVNIRVHAFEPCRGTYQTLVQRIKLIENSGCVKTVEKACSDSTGTSQFHVVGNGSPVNTLVLGANQGVIRIELVETVAIDDYCRKVGLNRIALAKIDAEGHDFDVIKGAYAMLVAHAIDVVQFEYNQKWVFARRFLRDCFELLCPLGYRVGKITPGGIEFYTGWVPELETFREGNYIACSAASGIRFKEILPPWERH